MNDSFFRYIQLLELLAFFSGYPIVYALVSVIKANKPNQEIRNTLFMLLPFTYAVIGLLYLGLQLKKLYPDYSLTHIKGEIENPFLVTWALLSLLFFVPIFSKKPFLSLLHGLIFFFVIVKNFYLQARAPLPDNAVIKNYLRVYSNSIILNLVVLLALLFLWWIIRKTSKKKRSRVAN